MTKRLKAGQYLEFTAWDTVEDKWVIIEETDYSAVEALMQRYGDDPRYESVGFELFEN